MTDLTLYGIANCDTVRKARRWLDAASIPFEFHDVRADGLDRNVVKGWLDAQGWETILNRRSTAWRALSESEKDGVNATSALALLLAHPTLIKRPVLCKSGECVAVGFKPAEYEALLRP